jgi:ABC-type sugar transport system substrate-binding protein
MKISNLIRAITVLAFLLAACAPTATPAPTDVPPMPEDTEAPAMEDTEEPAAMTYTYEDMTVGFIQTGSEGGWRSANTASFKETAEQLGINLKFYDAQNKLENQVSAFRNFIADPEVNVIILAALETTGWEDVLQEAKDAGKIVVLEDPALTLLKTCMPPTSAPTSLKKAARLAPKCANCLRAWTRRMSLNWLET